MLLKSLLILVFIVVSFNHAVYGIDWPWNWKKEGIICYTTCLAAVGTGAVFATPVAISAAGIGAAGIAAGSIGVAGVEATAKMVLASTVSPLCAAICGSSEERQGDANKQNSVT